MRSYVIGCDNAAVHMKDTIKKFLQDCGVDVEDIGCYTAEDSTVYPKVAEKLCKRISESDFEKHGILMCGTGIGMCISANKCKGIRAAVCHDNFSAERSILSNDANVLCFGERVIGIELAKKILSEWIKLEFKNGSSTPKVQAIVDLERKYFQ